MVVHLEKSGHPYHFVQSKQHNPVLVPVSGGNQDEVHGDKSSEVEQELLSEVVLSDLLPVLDQVELELVVGCVEHHKHIQDEHDLTNDVDIVP